ncbi:methyltransferase [Nocardioides sp. dk4132]|uniref:methyltransferase n=1 Tax=unclassified Nocardioides TaxID=2615069 RepID=UPI001294CB81|nr:MULTISPECIES: methyltransferase [unclassified Nocardioides]MQW75401.1 methyltransferase [Nocardioides sp. dk4132]QGA08326.1 methyltransferase [Nocardioides sp. dk884]
MTDDVSLAPTEEVTDFGELRIRFDERVLRPRAWTTEQSAWGAELLQHGPDGPVLELCTGAGQIGLLTLARAPRPLIAVDLNPVACDFARRNAADAGLGDLVEVREGPVDGVLRPEERFALVQADPPWVRRTDTDRYPEDPVLAIDGGDDGLALARTCAATAAAHLLDGGSLLLQLGTSEQAATLDAALEPDSGLDLVEVREFERGVVAHFLRTR